MGISAVQHPALDTSRLSAKLLFPLLISVGLSLPVFDRQPTFALATCLAFATIWHLVATAAWRRWDGADYAMTALLGSAFLSSLVGWRTPIGGWQGAFEWLAYWTSFMAVRHGAIAPTKLRILAATLIAGTLVGIALAAWNTAQADRLFELPGVQGTIRSSLYVGMLLVLCTGLAATSRGPKRLAWVGSAFVLTGALLALTSRAVIVATCLALAAACWWFSRRRFIAMLAVGLLAAGIAWSFLPPDHRDRFAFKTKELSALVGQGLISDNDAVRIETWRVAWAWVRRGENIFFGIGPRSFHLIDTEKLDLYPPLVHSESKQMSHAHNLFLTIYIEQGVFGLTALLAFLGVAMRHLWQGRQSVQTDWSWWGAWAAIVLPVVNGLVGSPWSREYAWLASTLIAIYLARSNPNPKSTPGTLREIS